MQPARAALRGSLITQTHPTTEDQGETILARDIETATDFYATSVATPDVDIEDIGIELAQERGRLEERLLHYALKYPVRCEAVISRVGIENLPIDLPDVQMILEVVLNYIDHLPEINKMGAEMSLKGESLDRWRQRVLVDMIRTQLCREPCWFDPKANPKATSGAWSDERVTYATTVRTPDLVARERMEATRRFMEAYPNATPDMLNEFITSECDPEDDYPGDAAIEEICLAIRDIAQIFNHERNERSFGHAA